ncbi:MAG TPA: PAS domain S-box protein [Polyangiaceae bacterium]|nr:PAS domain S-box protein [Polyangiaceae bacterium]
MNDETASIRTIFDNVEFFAWAMDKTGTMTLSEGKGLRTVGLEPGQLVGRSVFDIYRDEPLVIECAKRALAGEEFVMIADTGGRTFENRYASIRNAAGEFIGVAGISTDVTERIAAQRASEKQAEALRAQTELLDLAYDAIMARLLDGTITYWNRGAERTYGIPKEAALGKSSHSLLKTVFPKSIEEIERSLLRDGHWEGELTHKRPGGGSIIVASRWVLRRDAGGVPTSLLEINTDITARKKAEAEEAHARRQDEIIRAQALAIAELSTPLIPISNEILVMPLVGMMDSMRAKQVMENLLNGLSTSRGQFAIVDITGVSVVDTQVASVLVRAAHAVRLLGAEVILTGIRPEVAQTLVTIGADLSGIITRGTLQSGIAYATERGQNAARAHGDGQGFGR